MTETSGRLLKLLSLLQTRRDWPGNELADRLGVSGRTIRRDVERLRELGYPVDAVTGPAGGYRLHAGTAMPPLLLDDDEAVAIAVGLRTAAGASVTGIEETAIRALVKLEQVLPAHLRRRVNALQSVLATLPASGPLVDPETLTAIAGGCRERERLRFDYRSRDATESSRHVEPHSLVNLGRRWYLVAWDCDREDWRTFRVDRLERPRPAGTRFALRTLPAENPAAYVAANLKGAPARHQARVTLHATAPLGDGRADRRALVRVPRERRLAGLARDADRHVRRRVRGSRAARARRRGPRARGSLRPRHARRARVTVHVK